MQCLLHLRLGSHWPVAAGNCRAKRRCCVVHMLQRRLVEMSYFTFPLFRQLAALFICIAWSRCVFVFLWRRFAGLAAHQ